MRTLRSTLALIMLAVMVPAVAQEEKEDPADKAFNEGRKQYQEAQGHEAKFAVVTEFLKQYPDSKHTGVAVSLALNHLVDALEEYDRAIEFVEGVLGQIKEADRRFEIRTQLLSVYSKKEDGEGLARLAKKLSQSRTLNYTEVNDIVEAAVEAEDWKLVLKYSSSASTR